MTGYWKDSPDNPFNQMDYTRGGGGYDNDQTHESNDRRAFAMSGVDALPRFATPGVGAAVVDRGAQFVSGPFVYQNGKVPTSGPGNATAGTAAPGKGGTGPGVGAAVTTPKATGGMSSGSGFVIGAPYKPGFSPGVLNWQTPLQFSEAPQIGGIENKPLERVGIGGAQEAPGAVSDIGWARTAGGGYTVIPSRDVKERLEDNIFLEAQWAWRNVIGPSIGVMPQPVPDFLDPSQNHFDFWSGEWREGPPYDPAKAHVDRGVGNRSYGW